MKVYIAGASREITRAERWARRLVENDIWVTSSWMATIRQVGHGNPADAIRADYVKWTSTCFAEIRDAQVIWLLLPEADTVGAWIELGFAHALGKLVVMSGAHRPIFTPALTETHSPYDAEIADYLRRLAKADDTLASVPFKAPGVTKDWSL